MAPSTFFTVADALRRTGVVAVGVDAFQLEHDNFGAVFLDAFFGPCGRIGDHIFEGFECRWRPLVGCHIPDLHGDFRFVGHFPLKLIERVAGFAANSNGFVALTDGDRLDRTCIRFLVEFETQSYLLISYRLMIEVSYSNAVVHWSCGRAQYPGHEMKNLGPLSLLNFLYVVSTAVDKKPWKGSGGNRIGLQSAGWIVFVFM
jgi:hypothetical protein